MALRNMRVWRYLEEVARTGSVRQAAEKLHLTPSALLRRIQDVESDLGAALFERTSSGVLLTAAGEIFIAWIKNQNADLRRVYSQIEALAGLRRGEIRIACSQAVARDLLLTEMKAFRAEHPLVKMTVNVCDHANAMRLMLAYEADLILVFRPSHAAELQPLMSIGQGMVAVMARDHPLASKPKLRVRDCLMYDLALPDPSYSGRELIDQVLARGSMQPNPVIESNSFDLLADVVKGSEIISFQVDVGAGHWRKDPELAVRAIDEVDGAYGPLVLGQLKGRTLPLPAARFGEQLARRLDAMRSLPMDERAAKAERTARVRETEDEAE
ncbi:LysR family transcriptional regulator [Ideonella azotifigens]|uniref:LysR family transcriptional regulator n=1 Tax=Ideonella azotifigens TaxID=513160 RepID=A0ABN1K4U6_9BURK|nr:LysR family transcriptional regulator [Ideonella azotifigens]MCD2344457.1 LysR family transcriptional regulator [Ideonella azotifigens]